MSFMLTLFEQADFIKEVQSLLGERLLSVGYDDTELEKEVSTWSDMLSIPRLYLLCVQIRLVELFKTRFGADRLQSCEVMLRDIQDSRRINNTLRPKDDFPTAQEVHAAIPDSGIRSQALIGMFNTRVPRTDLAGHKFIALIKSVAVAEKGSDILYPSPDLPMFESSVDTELSAAFQTQILSSFFWPSLREDEFAVPAPISTLQKNFEQDFERIKNLRKLHWLSALGKATVELELEDRTVKFEGVQTWQASVIYAFQDDSQDVSTVSPASRTVQQLEESLQMDEVLVRNALAFWVGHQVLVEDEPDVFTVLEQLPSADGKSTTGASAPVQADTVISAVKSQDAVLQDNKPMYEMFMMGMLTNGGAMDAARITMMMKMVVPGGYNFGEDETRWLLSGMEEQGKVIVNGSNYSIKK
jgi:anaphase-promoting complex subunit 2